MNRQVEPYVMPDWMKPYTEAFNNTGGNDIEYIIDRFLTDDSLSFSNLPMYTIGAMVYAQVRLLEALHSQGLLKPLHKDD